MIEKQQQMDFEENAEDICEAKSALKEVKEKGAITFDEMKKRMKMKTKKKSLYIPRKLTLEEHRRIHAFLKHFHDEGRQVFDLMRQGMGDYAPPVARMAKAVNQMCLIRGFLEFKSLTDKPNGIDIESEEHQNWFDLYLNIGSWTTEGWK